MHLRSPLLITCLLLIAALPSVAQSETDEEQAKSGNTGRPFLIKPTEIKNIGNARETGSYLNQLLKLSKKDEFFFLSEKSDGEGFKSQKHQQFNNGIKVEYGIVTIHSKNNKIENVGGEVYEIPEALNPIASISEISALEAALQYTGAKKYKWENRDEEAFLKSSQGSTATYYPSGELVFVKVYIPAGGKTRDEMALAYKFDIYAEEPLSRKYVYVDAHSGAIIHVNSIIKHANGTAATRYSGTRTISTSQNNGNAYVLRDNTRSNGIETYNLNNGYSYSFATDFTDTDNNWTSTEFNNSKKDNVALDAHWGAMKTYDFFKEKFNRSSYDGQGAKIKSYVHYGTDYVNAFWNGSVMTYGDGSGSIDPLTSLDICAHEIGHAVCSSTANLVYANEPGALNESLSDIWGATIEHYAAPEKSPWLLGEDINFVIRSMSNPNEHNQPDTYLGSLWDPYQEVHANSGVMNHWYYILVEGKTGVDDNGVAYSVQGIGFDKAARIVYRMETTYLTSNSQYADARIAAIQSAGDLFGNSSVEVQQTRKAWDAVGVYDTTSSPTGLTATALSNTSVRLSWVDHATNEAGYSIERSLSFNSGFSEIATIAPNATSYSNFGLPTNAIYYFRVKAYFSNYSSSYSNVASVALGTPPVVMSNTTISTCSSVFLDPSGLSDYANNQSVTMRINPTEANKKVKISFSSFSLSAYDYLSIYDGDNISQNFIGAYTGNTIPPDINALNSSGFLTFVFYSDSYSTGAGWQANLTCETIPGAPTSLTATTATTTRINLTWQDNSSNETGFVVERKFTSSPGSSFIGIATLPANSTSYPDQGLVTDQTYSYRVRALINTTYSTYSNIADASVGNPPLIMQNGIYQICGSIFLDPGGYSNYNDNQSYVMRINPSEVGKKIKVSFSSFNLESGYDYLTIYDGDNVQENLIGSYTGNGLPPDIIALNSSGGLTFVFNSDAYVTGLGWQASLSCVTIPNAPGNLIATTASITQINLTWQDNSSNETNMVVERRAGSLSNSPFSIIATLAANTTSYSDQGLATDEKYYYRVRAFNGTAYSPYSNTADATVGTPVLLMQSGTFQICGSTFLDPGGYGDYIGYQYISMTVNPTQAGKKLKISFSAFNLGIYDYLTVYDGDALTSNYIGTYTGTTLPPDINALNETGGLTFIFYSNGYSPSSGWQAMLSCVDVPTAPSNLIGSAASGTQVNLSWQDNSTNETALVIERKSGLSNSQYAIVETVAANTTSYSDSNLPTDQRYFYRIKALNGTVSSAYSNEADIVLGNAPVLMTNGVFSTCSAQFFDSGYTGSYSNSENYTLTVNPSTSGQKMRVTFTSLNLESCCDGLSIYDGPSTGSTLIGYYNGNSLPPVITATNAQGSLTFRFYSDGSVTYSGWRLVSLVS
jgi:Zn-dependent metalloprotease